MSTISLWSLFSFFLLQTALGGRIMFPFCTDTDNFTPNSTYEANVNELMAYFANETNFSTAGFALGSKGHDADQVHGRVLCSVNASASDCATCFSDATNHILQNCAHSKAVIMWSDDCMFKYSDKHFFGQVENQTRVCVASSKNVSNPEAFNQKKVGLLSNLANEAGMTTKLEATGYLSYFDVEEGCRRVYGLVQCTRDLSSADCRSCLHHSINFHVRRCDGSREGGRVFAESCNLRYETYPFF